MQRCLKHEVRLTRLARMREEEPAQTPFRGEGAPQRNRLTGAWRISACKGLTNSVYLTPRQGGSKARRCMASDKPCWTEPAGWRWSGQCKFQWRLRATPKCAASNCEAGPRSHTGDQGGAGPLRTRRWRHRIAIAMSPAHEGAGPRVRPDPCRHGGSARAHHGGPRPAASVGAAMAARSAPRCSTTRQCPSLQCRQHAISMAVTRRMKVCASSRAWRLAAGIASSLRAVASRSVLVAGASSP